LPLPPLSHEFLVATLDIQATLIIRHTYNTLLMNMARDYMNMKVVVFYYLFVIYHFIFHLEGISKVYVSIQRVDIRRIAIEV